MENHWYLYIVNLIHMVMDCMDFYKHLVVVVMLELRLGKLEFRHKDSKTDKRWELTWNWITSCECITSVSILTITNWTVIVHTTFWIQTTSSNTWISTFLVFACLVIRTFRADNTFRSTTWWTSNISWETWANSLIIYFTTLRIWSARRWLTRIDILRNNRYMKWMNINYEKYCMIWI